MPSIIKVIGQNEQEPCTCCSSWLEHWKKDQGDDSPFCAHAHCLHPATKSAMVIRIDRNDMERYVMPTCKQHNHLGMEYSVQSFLVNTRYRSSCHSLSVVPQRVIPYPQLLATNLAHL